MTMIVYVIMAVIFFALAAFFFSRAAEITKKNKDNKDKEN